MPTLRRSGSWGSLAKPRDETSTTELEPPPSARGETTGSELWREEAAANGFDPNLLFTRSKSQQSLAEEMEKRARDGKANQGSEPDDSGKPITRKKSSKVMRSAAPSPGGERITRRSSNLSRKDSFGSVDVGTLLDMGFADSTQLVRGTSLVRTRSQERLAQACKDLGMQQVLTSAELAGQAAQRLNSRGRQGVNAVMQDMAQGRQEDLASDLFGLDMSLAMGAPPEQQLKRGAPAGLQQQQPRKVAKVSPRGGTPRGGQAKAVAAAEEVSQSPTGQDPWVMRNVKLKRGKYEGRNAYVLGKTSKKYQVQVEGVPYQLEFYATMFCLPEHYKEPKNARRKKKAMDAMEASGMEHLGDTCALGFGGVPAELGVLTGQVVRTRSQERMANMHFQQGYVS